jgi:hypothetical protein
MNALVVEASEEVGDPQSGLEAWTGRKWQT